MKNLRLKITLFCLFSLVIVTTVNCNILSRNANAIYQENDGPGKEMVYVVLNIGRIVGNMVFTMDDDLLVNTPNIAVSERTGKPDFWSVPGNIAVFLGGFILFFLTMFMLYRWKSGEWFSRKGALKSP